MVFVNSLLLILGSCAYMEHYFLLNCCPMLKICNFKQFYLQNTMHTPALSLPLLLFVK